MAEQQVERAPGLLDVVHHLDVVPKIGAIAAAGVEITAVWAAESSKSRREHMVLLLVTVLTLRNTLYAV